VAAAGKADGPGTSDKAGTNKRDAAHAEVSCLQRLDIGIHPEGLAGEVLPHW
jgi:hypothetical protein